MEERLESEREIHHGRRTEIQPTPTLDEDAAPPERPVQKRADDPDIQGAIGPNAMSFILTAKVKDNQNQPNDQRFLGLGLKQ